MSQCVYRKLGTMPCKYGFHAVMFSYDLKKKIILIQAVVNYSANILQRNIYETTCISEFTIIMYIVSNLLKWVFLLIENIHFIFYVILTHCLLNFIKIQ